MHKYDFVFLVDIPLPGCGQITLKCLVLLSEFIELSLEATLGSSEARVLFLLHSYYNTDLIINRLKSHDILTVLIPVPAQAHVTKGRATCNGTLYMYIIQKYLTAISMYNVTIM